MEYGLLAKHIRALEGVTGVTVADAEGRCLAREDCSYPGGLAAATVLVMNHAAQLAEMLGLGESPHVDFVCGLTRVALIGNANTFVAIEYAWPADSDRLAAETVGLLAAYR